MTHAARQEYHNDESVWVLFDLRDHKQAKSLHLQRAALRELGELEFIDADHAVLIAFAGGARSPGK